MGEVRLEYRFSYDGGGLRKGGEMAILANGELLAKGRIERTVTIVAPLGETFDVGHDAGLPVLEGNAPFEGDIYRIEVRPGPLGFIPF